MLRIDWSEKDEYYTQLNNKRFPLSACNVTSAVMFLRSNKIPYVNPTDEQDEDYLMWLIHEPDGYDAVERLTPWFVDKKSPKVKNWKDAAQVSARYPIPPNQIWQVLAWGINRIAGAHIAECRLGDALRLNEFLFELARGRTMIVGGKFTESGHFVNAVGFVTEQQSALDAKTPIEVNAPEVVSIIVDDPYGNYLTGYQDHRGNSVEIPIEKFLDVIAVYRHKAYGPPRNRIYAITRVAA